MQAWIDNLLEQFNTFFEGTATVAIKEDRVEVTIGTRTLIISLPAVIGGQSEKRGLPK